MEKDEPCEAVQLCVQPHTYLKQIYNDRVVSLDVVVPGQAGLLPVTATPLLLWDVDALLDTVQVFV